MTLQQLRTFLAVVECGSFRRAAKELAMSQAAVTMNVQALEAALGTSLLVRSARGAMPTKAGTRLLPHARLISHEVQRTMADFHEPPGAIRGVLRIGLGHTPAAMLLPLVLPDFHRRFPAVKLDVRSGFYEHLQPALQEGHIDLAITALTPGAVMSGFKSKLLFRSELVVIARPGHPMRQARSLRELASCEWVMLGAPGRPGGSVIAFHAAEGLPPPRIAAICESTSQLASLIESTDWLALVPAAVLARGLFGPVAEPIALNEPLPRPENFLVYRAGAPLSPGAAEFAAMCESCARVVMRH